MNAITDVAGVRVGVTTLIEGDGPLEVGTGPIRTGVTASFPHEGIGEEPLFAGCHRLNGNGELTGLEWVRESGLLTTPIALTNTHSVGVVRDALVAFEVRSRPKGPAFWSLPVVGETYDGALNDINGQHVRPEHLFAAIESARRPGPRRQRRGRHRHDLPRLQGWDRDGVTRRRGRPREQMDRRGSRAGQSRSRERLRSTASSRRSDTHE